MFDINNNISGAELTRRINELLKLNMKELATEYAAVTSVIFIVAARASSDPLESLDKAHLSVKQKLLKAYTSVKNSISFTKNSN